MAGDAVTYFRRQQDEPMPTAEERLGAHRPRALRELARMRSAAAAARSEPRGAMAAALAQIEAAFDEAAAINDFKIRVERLVRRGPHHPAVRARFGTRAAMLYGRDLDAATALVERWWRDERKAFQIASAFGSAPRLSLEVLRELRLILRLLRVKRLDAAYQDVIAALCEVPIAAAME
jgi:hypothetical protein